MNMLLFLEIFSLVHMEIGNKLASAQGPEEPELIPDHEDHEKEMKIWPNTLWKSSYKVEGKGKELVPFQLKKGKKMKDLLAYKYITFRRWATKGTVSSHRKGKMWFMAPSDWLDPFSIILRVNKVRLFGALLKNAKGKGKENNNNNNYKQQQKLLKMKWAQKCGEKLGVGDILNRWNIEKKYKFYYYNIIEHQQISILKKKMILKLVSQNRQIVNYVINYFDSVFHIRKWLHNNWTKHMLIQSFILNELKIYNLNYVWNAKLKGIFIKLKGPIKSKKLDRTKTLIKMYGSLNLSNVYGYLTETKSPLWTKLGTIGVHIIIH